MSEVPQGSEWNQWTAQMISWIQEHKKIISILQADDTLSTEQSLALTKWKNRFSQLLQEFENKQTPFTLNQLYKHAQYLREQFVLFARGQFNLNEVQLASQTPEPPS